MGRKADVLVTALCWTSAMVAPEPFIPVVGQPVAWALGLVALLLIVFTGTWAMSLVTVAHEGGHFAMSVLSGRRPTHVELKDDGGGETVHSRPVWGLGWILTILAGYLTPPLLGLAGATAIRNGLSWSVLWAAVILLFAGYFQAKGGLTNAVVLLAGAGIAWAAVAGNTTIRAAVAVGLVWIMLFGAIKSLTWLGTGGGTSDPALLRKATWIPGILWVALFWAVAVSCLFFGAKRILIP
jgi:hypothetical protein